ncbi:hypothetical protein GUJ93_ZPchr0006g42384 [Zizania palustris]|uniref:AIPP2-like SPOC-like domain-containing protein n=1 Tax=Zizania palustris TaxID=103762 RepID=A0A8J5W2R6_ZIZPA|nr:hypothetical protein GUJ93_ZPchr0006g42384 [Zizania palustris]
MASAARPSARRPPNPSPAAAAAARLRDAPPRAAQDTKCQTCGDIIDPGNVKRCQCKKTPEHVKNGVHHSNDAMQKEKGSSRPNSSNKYRTHKSSGGTYSKPDARVKLIPEEEIAYVQHGKRYGKTVGSTGLQKRHCRRSVTPPSSRKVSLVKSTMVTQEPKQPVSPVISCISPMRPKTTENGVVLSQPSGTSPVICNLGTLQCQGTRIAVSPAVQKRLTTKPVSLSSKSVPSEKSTEAYLNAKSRPSSSPDLFDAKCKVGSWQGETIIPPTKSLQSTSLARCVELSNDFEAVPSKKGSISSEKQTNQEAPINCNVTLGTPVILHTKLHKKHYQPDACWKGKFEVTGVATHTCDGLEAYFPFEISVRVYETSKWMPEILKLEAIPLSQLWPKAFKMKPPDGQDIGLCFISSLQRPDKNSEHLLENISLYIGLRTNIGATELLIFSSKLLTQEYQKKYGKFYFWGVFRKLHRSYNQTKNMNTSKSLSSGDSCIMFEDIGTNLRLTDGKELKSGKCGIGVSLYAEGSKEIERDKSKESSKILENRDREIERETAEPCIDSSLSVDLDTPPELSLDASPGFTKAKCLPRTGETAGSYIDSSPILSLDTPPGFPLDVPPGFTEAHPLPILSLDTPPGFSLDVPPGFSLEVPPGFTEADRLPSGYENDVFEKKPPIDFILNAPRPVQTEVFPGFTKLLAVKQEPGLARIYNTTEKVASIGKGDETNIKHSEV